MAKRIEHHIQINDLYYRYQSAYYKDHSTLDFVVPQDSVLGPKKYGMYTNPLGDHQMTLF